MHHHVLNAAPFSRLARCSARKGKKAREAVGQSVVQLKQRARRKDFSEIRSMLAKQPFHAGVHADYRRDDYVFPRTQSLEMRAMSWEDRMPPLKHWGSNLIANLAWEIFA